MKEFTEAKEFKNKLSQKAKDYLRDEATRSLNFYKKEFVKTAKSNFLPASAKIEIKRQEKEKIDMFKEILEAVK